MLDLTKPHLLRFGVPSLDALIGIAQKASGSNEETNNNQQKLDDPGYDSHISHYGLPLQTGISSGSSNVCIVGTAGTGKSILALHMASRYMADCEERRVAHDQKNAGGKIYHPCVFFVSTDLDAGRANKLWQDFQLNLPNGRSIPFTLSVDGKLQNYNFDGKDRQSFFLYKYPALPPDLSLGFKDFRDGGRADRRTETEAIRKYIQNPDKHLGFLDLHSQTKGDDWAFINRLLATLPEDSSRRSLPDKHLVVIDAVEGLDLLGSEYDAFGERRPRESRITQLIRSAAGKCHLLFVVEQPTDAHRLAEIFSADLLINLKQDIHQGYAHRTVQITKARGQSHVSGIHLYDIRNNKASLTGVTENPDQPHWGHSYIHVFHSPDALTHFIETRDGRVETHGKHRPTFGIRYLDAMLGYDLEGDGSEHGDESEHGDVIKTEGNTLTESPRNVTALIGNTATYKSTLGNAFLSECLDGGSKFPHYKNCKNEKNVGILLTTQLLDKALLADNIFNLLGHKDHSQDEENQAKKDIQEWLICRRLPVQAIKTSEFFHIVESAIWEARSLMAQRTQMDFGPNDHRDRWQGKKDCPRIRLVIDDWSVIENNYPDIKQHPEFLEFLKQYLKWQGVTTLMIETQAGTPTSGMRVENERDCHIYTWKVSFYNEERVAIAVQPPPPSSSSLKATVRELKRREDIAGEETGNQKPDVDPHFEYYSGLEKGEPHPLPLKVCLFAGSSGSMEYLDETEELLRRFFTGVNGGGIVERENAENYEDLRLLALSPHKQRLDFTQIVQVDEFWQHSDDVPHKHSSIAKRQSEGAKFCSSYMNARTVDGKGKPTPEDPFRLFQTSEATDARNNDPQTLPTQIKGKEDRRRHSFFPFKEPRFQDNEKYDENREKTTIEMDAGPRKDLSVVPMTWDFGFLMCRRRSWMSAKENRFKRLNGKIVSVLSVFKWLEKNSSFEDSTWLNQSLDEEDLDEVTWYDFFQACRLVAQTQLRHGTPEPVFAFDFDMSSTEGISCLIQEIMASELNVMAIKLEREIAEGRSEDSELEALQYRWSQIYGTREYYFPENSFRLESSHHYTLIDLIKDETCQEALLRALILVFAVTEPEQFNFGHFDRQERPASKHAVAARQWYSTACRAMSDWEASDPTVPWCLPGNYSVRGDWFLTIADGSQSQQLAKGALDLLSSRRANLARMREGVGLPTRSMWGIFDEQTKLFTIRPEQISDSASFHDSETPGETPQSQPPHFRRRMRYEEIQKLGATGTNHLDWIWRSHFRYYQRHSRIWNRWLNTFAQTWHRRTLHPEHKNMDAFKLYRTVITEGGFWTKTDLREFYRKTVTERETLLKSDPGKIYQLIAHEFFHSSIDRLLKDLQDATPLDPPQQPNP